MYSSITNYAADGRKLYTPNGQKTIMTTTVTLQRCNGTDLESDQQDRINYQVEARRSKSDPHRSDGE